MKEHPWVFVMTQPAVWVDYLVLMVGIDDENICHDNLLYRFVIIGYNLFPVKEM